MCPLSALALEQPVYGRYLYDMEKSLFYCGSGIYIQHRYMDPFSICYLSMYVHDRTAVYSLGQHYLEMALENGAEVEERELREGLENYLSEKLLISHTGRIRVKEGLVSVEAEIPLLLAIRFPFIKEILTGQEGKGYIYPMKN